MPPWKLNPPSSGYSSPIGWPEGEEDHQRRHHQDQQRRPPGGQQPPGIVKQLGGITPVGENADDRRDEYQHHQQRAGFPDRFRQVGAAVGQRHRVEQHRRVRVGSAEITRRRHRGGHDRKDDQDPDQHRHVAERLDIGGHQLAHQPVGRQPQHPRDGAQDGGGDTAQKGDEQRVEHPHEGGAQVRRLVGVMDQGLVDVVTGRLAKELERDVLPLLGQVAHEVHAEVGHEHDQQHQRDELERVGPIARVVDQHRQPERLPPEGR